MCNKILCRQCYCLVGAYSRLSSLAFDIVLYHCHPPATPNVLFCTCIISATRRDSTIWTTQSLDHLLAQLHHPHCLTRSLLSLESLRNQTSVFLAQKNPTLFRPFSSPARISLQAESGLSIWTPSFLRHAHLGWPFGQCQETAASFILTVCGCLMDKGSLHPSWKQT